MFGYIIGYKIYSLFYEIHWNHDILEEEKEEEWLWITEIYFVIARHIDASLFYDAIVNSTDDYIYLVDMQSDISLISENMYLDFDLPGRLVKGLVPIWGDLIVDKDRKRYDESMLPVC